MSVYTELYLILALIYLLESFFRGGREGVFITRSFRGKSRITRTDGLLSARGGVFFFGGFFPWNETFYLPFPAVSYSRLGVYPHTGHTVNVMAPGNAAHRGLTYEEISDIRRDERSVLVNETLFLKAESAHQADGIVRQISRLGEGDELSRDMLINEMLRHEFSDELIAERLTLYRKASCALKVLSAVYFFFLFAAAPLLIRFADAVPAWGLILSGLCILNTGAVILYRRGHRMLYPGRTGERNLQTAVFILSPPVTLRAADFLSRDLLTDFNFAASSSVLLPRSDAIRLTRLAAADLLHPLEIQSGMTLEAGIRNDYLKRYTKYYIDFMNKNDFTPDAVPDPGDLSGRYHCPRCFQGYDAEGVCADCGKVLAENRKKMEF